MNKSGKSKPRMDESDSESDVSITPAEAMVDALEMYLEAYKLNSNSICYNLGMKAVYFSKAVFAYLDTGNKDLVKNSKKAAITALVEAITKFETDASPQIHVIKAAKLVVEALKNV